MRLIHRAGESCFVDYAGLTVAWVEPQGHRHDAQIFVGCLGASSYTYVEATRSQALIDWLDAHANMFSFFGGVPQQCIPDNLKSGVTTAHRYDPDVNLTYQHFDAGHNHIHILTTNIDADGTRISLHNIGKLKSEPARKAIEQEYGLVKAEDHARSIANQKNAKPLIYGATDTKRAISNIVSHVSQAYKFTSLAEFNAVLAGYNVVADRGPKATVMFEHGGLRYWALDDQGNKTGVPQKASSLYKKPTLKLLGERFKLNEYLRKPFKNSLSNIIDRAIPQVSSHQELKALLKNKAIDLLIRQNAEGRIYGLTFIDHNNKVVFNGSDLGKAYSAAAIEARYGQEHLIQVGKGKTSVEQHASTHEILNASETQQTTIDLLGDLLSPTEGVNNQSLFDRKKKKKRRRLKL